MPLLEIYYAPDPPGPSGPLFATSAIDERNNAMLAGAEDVVTIRGVIVAQSIIPLYNGLGQVNGSGFAGAQIEEKYRPANDVREVGYNTTMMIPGGGSIPDPALPFPAADPTYGAAMAVFITPGGNIQVGSFDWFSVFFEPCSVNFQYIAANPPETTNPEPPPPGGGGAAGNAMHGVVRLDGR